MTNFFRMVLEDQAYRARVGEKKYKEWADKVRAEGNGTVGDIVKELTEGLKEYNKKKK